MTTLTLHNSFADSATGIFGLGVMGPEKMAAYDVDAGVLYRRVGFGAGGGNLTITGTLANTKTVQVGSGFLNAGAANTLTLGALTNARSGSFQVCGSVTHSATLPSTAAGFTTNDATCGLTNITPLTIINSFTAIATGAFGPACSATVSVSRR